ncbi:MAG TPA: hypothetical protein PLT07_07420 [Trueperaceae bacterium]|nr:hypothetical protein [Trueperaceae bacterium]
MKHFLRKLAATPLLRRSAGVAATLALLALPMASAQSADLTKSPPPAPYVGVDTILPLPAFIPGAGALFIDPAVAPNGPWLVYGKDGGLVEVLFMIPVSQFDKAANWSDLATGLLAQTGMTVDHVDITYNGGHPGMAEPHYHIRLVLVDAATDKAQLNP